MARLLRASSVVASLPACRRVVSTVSFQSDNCRGALPEVLEGYLLAEMSVRNSTGRPPLDLTAVLKSSSKVLNGVDDLISSRF